MRNRIIVLLGIAAAVLTVAAPGSSQNRDPDVRSRLEAALERSLENAKFEHKRKEAALRDIADSGWTGFPVNKSEAEWRRALDDETFAIARQGRDDFATPNDALQLAEGKVLLCGACGAPLFDATARAESSTPGLHFSHAHGADAVITDRHSEWSLENGNVELRCGTCGAHLGYVDPGATASDPLRLVVNPKILEPSTEPKTSAGSDG